MTLQRADVRDYWDRMRAGVVECLRGHDERPEDIYAWLLFQKAALYVNEDGFAVVQPIGTDCLEVTCVAKWPGVESRGAIERAIGEMVDLARREGFKRLRARTSKEHVMKLLSTWKRNFIEYELEIGR